jgi:heme exporter protein C
MSNVESQMTKEVQIAKRERRSGFGLHPSFGICLSTFVIPLLAAVVAIFWLAPTEQTKGNAQRIVYVHVAVAWCTLTAFLATAATGIMYLIRRDLAWDHWSQAAAEWGWVCGAATLATGSLWARLAWGAWWTWEPRLLATFILWAIYSGYLIVRGGVEDHHRRARLGAVVAILGAVDLPMVLMATRWFRGMHPASPTMEPRMRLALLVSVLAFTALVASLVARRRARLRRKSSVVSCQM